MKELSVGYEKIECPLPGNSTGNLLKRALERSSVRGNPNKNVKPFRKLGSPEVSRVSLVCAMYHAALNTLSQLKLDILSGKIENHFCLLIFLSISLFVLGLCYNDSFLHDLWLLLASLGSNCGYKGLVELLQGSGGSHTYPPQLLFLLLFCDCMTHYVT